MIPYSVNAQLWGDQPSRNASSPFPATARSASMRSPIRNRPRRPARLAVPRRHGAGQDVLRWTWNAATRKSRKRLETRLLHFQQFPGTQEYGDQYWRGYTYVWNDDQTDADLLDEKGADKLLKIKVGDKVGRAELPLPEPGGVYAVPHQRRQVRAGRQHHADEPRPRLRRRRSPTSLRRWSTSACSRRSCPTPRRSCRSWPITTTRSCRSTCGPGRICTPTAPIAT